MSFLLHQGVLLAKQSQKVKDLNNIVWSYYWKRKKEKENENEINISILLCAHDVNSFEINQ